MQRPSVRRFRLIATAAALAVMASGCSLVEDRAVKQPSPISGAEASAPDRAEGASQFERTTTSQPAELTESDREAIEVTGYSPGFEATDPGGQLCAATAQAYQSGQNLLGLSPFQPPSPRLDLENYRRSINFLAESAEVDLGSAAAQTLERYGEFLADLDDDLSREAVGESVMGYLGSSSSAINGLLNGLSARCSDVMPLPESPVEQIQRDFKGGQ